MAATRVAEARIEDGFEAGTADTHGLSICGRRRSSEQPGERQRNHDAQGEQHQALSVLRFHDVASLSGSASSAALDGP
jgi:hypothetical protein